MMVVGEEKRKEREEGEEAPFRTGRSFFGLRP